MLEIRPVHLGFFTELNLPERGERRCGRGVAEAKQPRGQSDVETTGDPHKNGGAQASFLWRALLRRLRR